MVEVARYQALAQRESPDALIILSQDGHVLHWNGGARAIFGFEPDEAIDRRLADLILAPERSREEEHWRAKTLARGSSRIESLFRRKDGGIVSVEISSKVVRECALGAPLLLLNARDIARPGFAPSRGSNEAGLRDLLESMPDGIFLVDAAGRIAFANSQGARMFGYSAQELRGSAVELLMPPRLHASHALRRVEYCAEARTRAMGSGLELFGVRSNGSEFPVEISLSPLRMGGSTHTLSAVRDISERKRVAQALHEKNVQLENAGKAKDRFLASMSHELRTPLNAIFGFTGTLLMGLPGPLTADQESQLTTIKSSARHLLSLIDDLLDLAKIEAEKVDLKRELLDCRAVLDELAAALRPASQSKGLDLLVSGTVPAAMLYTDRRVLSQILINLIDNAIKFTESGSVSVAVTRPDSHLPAVVQIDVRDTGRGISGDDLSRLFQPFSRLESQGGQRAPGTGLGLHLSRKLAELLGGTLTCSSVRGVGSTFTLRIAGA